MSTVIDLTLDDDGPALDHIRFPTIQTNTTTKTARRDRSILGDLNFSRTSSSAKGKGKTVEQSDDEIEIIAGPYVSPVKSRTPKTRRTPFKRSNCSATTNAVASSSKLINALDNEGITPSRQNYSQITYATRGAVLSEDERLARQLQEEDTQALAFAGRLAPEDLALARQLQEEDARALASSSKVVPEDLALARQLQEEDAQALALARKIAPEDLALAQRLATQEREEYNRLIQKVHNEKHGIVFRQAINADGSLEDGTAAHPDDLARFEPWRALFEQSGTKVKKFHWIVNYELEKRFEDARTALEALTGNEPQELQLFHGTRSANIESILDGGFRIGGMGGHAVTNGAAFGYGIYLASAAATSIGYAMDANRIFACRVLPGRSTANAVYSRTIPTSTELGHEQYESFQSLGIYVVRYTSLVLPCYMIEYDNPYNRYANPAVGAWAGGLLPLPAPFGGALPAAGLVPPIIPMPIVPARPARKPRVPKPPKALKAPRRRRTAKALEDDEDE